MIFENKKVALALGGGGVRRLAHICVLKVLEELGLELYCIAGTFIGAIVGVGYSLFKNTNILESKILSIVKECKLEKLHEFSHKSTNFDENDIKEKILTFFKDIYTRTVHKKKISLLNSEWLDKPVSKLVNQYTFKDLKIPFSTVAVDLQNGEEIIINEGDLFMAIKASCSIPGIFPPVHFQGRELVDGGVISVTPVEACRKMGPDKIIAVNVERSLKEEKFQYGWNVVTRCDRIKNAYINKMNLAKADVVLNIDLPEITWSEFAKAKECIDNGHRIASSYKEKIKKLYSRFC